MMANCFEGLLSLSFIFLLAFLINEQSADASEVELHRRRPHDSDLGSLVNDLRARAISGRMR